jgi:hypothetical protein
MSPSKSPSMSPSKSPSLSPSASVSPSIANEGTIHYLTDTHLSEIMQSLNEMGVLPDNIYNIFYSQSTSKYVVMYS